MNNFVYDDTAPYDVNFSRWYYANTVERELYKDVKISIEQAAEIFKNIYSEKLN